MKEKKVKLEDFTHGGFKSLIEKALQLGVDVSYVSQFDYILKFQYLGEFFYAKKNVVPAKRIQAKLTKDKDVTKAILDDMGISTPKGIMVETFEEAKNLIKKNKMKYPLIAKPSDGSRAVGVTWDIKNEDDLKKAVNLIKKKQKEKGVFLRSRKFIVEEMFEGDEFRVLVFDNKIASCIHKIPATVEGDGIKSIKELIDEFNLGRKDGFKIVIDSVVKKTLSQKNLTLKFIVPKNEKLRLRFNMNMSDGGRSVECTSKMNKRYKGICIEAVKKLGLSYGGVDLMTKDISSDSAEYVILEVNPNPYYNMHEKPLAEGNGIDFSTMFLKSIFPKLNINKI